MQQSKNASFACSSAEVADCKLPERFHITLICIVDNHSNGSPVLEERTLGVDRDRRAPADVLACVRDIGLIKSRGFLPFVDSLDFAACRFIQGKAQRAKLFGSFRLSGAKPCRARI